MVTDGYSHQKCHSSLSMKRKAQLSLGFLTLLFILLISNCFKNKVMRLSMTGGANGRGRLSHSSCFCFFPKQLRGTEALGARSD